MRLGRVMAALVAALLLTGCSWGALTSGSVETLAKIDGWRTDDEGAGPFAVLELAYDDATAHAMWQDNVAADLAARDGKPVEAGVYGDLADVDFSRQVVGLYSSGQSGSCPGWVDAVEHDDGTVDVTTTEDLRGGDGCSDDYNAYRVIVAIDRDDVPDRDLLPSAEGTVDGRPVLELVVSEYPRAP